MVEKTEKKRRRSKSYRGCTHCRLIFPICFGERDERSVLPNPPAAHANWPTRTIEIIDSSPKEKRQITESDDDYLIGHWIDTHNVANDLETEKQCK